MYRKNRFTAAVIFLLAGLCLSIGLTSTRAFAGQALLSENDGLYPRIVALSHNADNSKNGAIIASVTSFTGGGHEDIFVSHDHGLSFTLAGQVTDTNFNKGLCCGGLYELPVAIGAMPAGTLLWAGSVGGDTAAEPMQLRIFKSTDQGAHWAYLSNCATGSKPRNGGGLWEPEFTIGQDGKLICFYSDETETGHSQVLKLTQSSDGVTWSTPIEIVASNTQADRPGMANVVRLPDSSYLMSFEMCGPLNCAAFLKTSPDGVNWGDPASHGAAIATDNGATFWHTPTLAWAPVAGSATGQLVLQGQIFVKNGAPITGNGKTLLLNAAGDGTGPWVAFDAATAITMPAGTAGNFCQNYSSPLLALDGGKKLLQLASDFVSGNTCKTYFKVAPLGGVKASATTLSVAKGASATGTVSLRSSANQAGVYNLSVDIPGLPAEVTLSDASVTLSAITDTTVQVTVKPTTLAATNSRVLFAGLFGVALLGLIGIRHKNGRVYPLLALLALPLILTGCGGGGGSSGGGGGTTPTPVSTTYSGTLTATSAADPTVTTSAPFTVTITKTS
ncbi:sialidase family protein [Asticcacaulis sp.]|uniref:sialidase family protein n=1 Tax=Asticcacaulis sp. TaxID=1872648 RepID=UPI002BFE2216|nr:sialidase family protein [Asticcacaulis sp.]HTM81661.1 sialidase family protein [Asticcacaulis sp.]